MMLQSVHSANITDGFTLMGKVRIAGENVCQRKEGNRGLFQSGQSMEMPT